MPTALSLLLWAAFAAAVAGAVHLWRRHEEARRLEDLRALAARRGWSLTVTGERLGQAGSLRLAPRGGNPWVAESRPRPPAGEEPATTYEAEEPRWAEGTLVLAPAAMGLSALEARAAALGIALPPPVAGPEGILALASAEPGRRADMGDLARAMGAWAPTRAGPRGLPLVVLGPGGLRLALGHAVTRADQAERFVDLAQDLTRLIGP